MLRKKTSYVHLLTATAIVYTFCPLAEVYGQTVSDRALSDVTAQTVGDCTTMTIRFHGRVQLLSFFPQTSGRELNIRIRPLDDTGIFGRESLRAPTGIPALRSIEFEGDNASGPTLSLFFKRDVKFDVAAGIEPETIIVSVSETGNPTICKPIALGNPTSATEPKLDATTPTLAKSAPDTPIPAGLYVINVISQPDKLSELSIQKASQVNGGLTYETSFERDGLTWHRLRVGFFETKAAAEVAAKGNFGSFP